MLFMNDFSRHVANTRSHIRLNDSFGISYINRMKIEIVLLFGIISVSSAVEFNTTTNTTNATTAIPTAASNRLKIIALHYNATATQNGE